MTQPWRLLRGRWWLAALGRDHVRLSLATLCCVIGGVILGGGWVYNGFTDPLLNFNVVWVVFSASYLLMTGVVFARSTPQSTRAWALNERRASKSRLVRWFIGNARGSEFVVTVAMFSVIAAVLMIRSDTAGSGEVILGSAGVVLSWLMLQVAFTLSYAFAFFNGGGIALNDEPEPDLLDFTYVAFTVGTSFTVVDVTITTRQMRRAVLGHSVLSFTFNTVLLGLVVTFLAG